MDTFGKTALFPLAFALGMLFGVLLVVFQTRVDIRFLFKVRTVTINKVWNERSSQQNSGLNHPKLKTLRSENISSYSSKLLEGRVRILCWVMTQPSSHKTKAQYSRMTWAKQCDKCFYISEGSGPSDETLPVIKVDAVSSRSGLWDKVKEAFKLIHKDYKGQYDWVLKADDDSFVNLIALRKLLSPLNSSEALFLGEKMNARRPDFHLPQGFMAGGGGYILSREAVRRFVTQLADNRSDEQTGCRRQGLTSEEDPRIAECLHDVNVLNIDTRDPDGFATFSHFSAEEKLISNRYEPLTFWYWGYQPWVSTKDGVAGCCSNKVVSFHYVSPFNMFAYNYLINNVNPHDTASTIRAN